MTKEHPILYSAPMWQPIETAPKDGTRILVVGNGWKYPNILWWSAIHKEWIDNILDEHYRFPDHVAWGYIPTHWMPLPEAPRSGGDNVREE